MNELSLKMNLHLLVFTFIIKFLSFPDRKNRDGFGPNFSGPRPIWADLLWAGQRLGPFSNFDLWAWAGPGLSWAGLDWALGRPDDKKWTNLGQFWATFLDDSSTELQ